MRSNLVYSANKRLSNRFLLCRVTSLAAKRMHRDASHFSASINEGLTHIASMTAASSREIDLCLAGNDPVEITVPNGLVQAI